MLEKVVHVIVIGLSEEERLNLDERIRGLLRYSDPVWQYSSYGCESVEEAVRQAKGMRQIDILYVAKKLSHGTSVIADLEHAMRQLQEVSGKDPLKTVLCYASSEKPNKLFTTIIKLWRDRHASEQYRSQKH